MKQSYKANVGSLCCHKFVSSTSTILLHRIMQIVSLQFFKGPNTVLVFHKPDCESYTKELLLWIIYLFCATSLKMYR